MTLKKQIKLTKMSSYGGKVFSKHLRNLRQNTFKVSQSRLKIYENTSQVQDILQFKGGYILLGV